MKRFYIDCVQGYKLMIVTNRTIQTSSAITNSVDVHGNISTTISQGFNLK